MDFFEVIEKRHCVRSYDPAKNVDDADLEKIIEAGKRAPSAGGLYPTMFFVAKTDEEKAKITPALHQDWIADAPVLIVIWSDPSAAVERFGQRAEDLYIIQDAAAAAENIFLATVALGLSACWVGSFDDEKLKKALELKADQRPFVVMPIGYKNEN